jgi:hypothetical protein
MAPVAMLTVTVAVAAVPVTREEEGIEPPAGTCLLPLGHERRGLARWGWGSPGEMLAGGGAVEVVLRAGMGRWRSCYGRGWAVGRDGARA